MKPDEKILNSLVKLINKAKEWELINSMIYNEPYSLDQFSALVNSINDLHSIIHEIDSYNIYAGDVADLNIKLSLARNIDMDKFWDRMP